MVTTAEATAAAQRQALLEQTSATARRSEEHLAAAARERLAARDTISELLLLFATWQKHRQDAFITAHLPGSVTLAGDHVFSTQRFMSVRDDDLA